jgi:hypothetical protein
MKLEIEFTQEEITKFLMSKGYTCFIKDKPTNTFEATEWVSDVAGFEYPKYEIFNKLIKKRLLEW